MSATKNMQSAETIALYDKLIATHPEIERKGAANPYTSLNGNMFTMLSPSGVMALRLPEEERKKFLGKHKTKLFEAYGAVMKEYVAVPEELLGNTKVMKKYLEMSYEYAKTLKARRRRRDDGRVAAAGWIPEFFLLLSGAGEVAPSKNRAASFPRTNSNCRYFMCD